MKKSINESMLIRSSKAGGFIRTNTFFQKKVGYTDEELNQKPLIEWIVKSDQKLYQKAIENNNSCVVGHKTKLGSHILLDITVRDMGEGAMVIGLNGEYHLENKLEHEAADDATVKSTLHAIAEIMEQQNPGYFCSILLVAHGRFVAGAGPSLPDEYNNAIDGFAIGPTIGSCGTAIYWNVPVIVEDIQNDPLWLPFAKLAKKVGVASCWSHPFVAKGGEVLGALAFYSQKPSLPTDEQLDRLKAAAKITGLAVERGRAEEELRSANDVKMRFMANMSHEIRTPLNAFIGITDTFDDSNDNVSKEDMSILRNSGEQLLELFSGVLELTELDHRMDQGKIIDLTECCGELVNALIPSTTSKKIDFEYNIDSSIPNLVSIDVWAFERAINLLLGNAIKFTESGKVSIDFRFENQKLLIKIEDSGCGIDLDHLDKLRQPFVQGDLSTKKNYGGFGLGLALSDLCIRALGGKVSFDITSTHGTEVSIVIPIVLATKPLKQQETFVLKHQCDSDTPILVAEDNPVNGKVICKILRNTGYFCDLVLNGEKAVEAYAKKKYCCILMDCQMPIMDGYEATQKIRSLEKGSKNHVPIIAVTANALAGDRDLCLQSGMDEYLKKPVRKNELLSMIQKYIGVSLS